MVARFMLTVAALLATSSLAQSQEAQPKGHHHHQKSAPEVENAAAPQEAVALPEKVQKWFGNSVEGILGGADDVLEGDKKR